MVKIARLRDWFLGPFVTVATTSDIVDFILYADWYNHSHIERLTSMRLIRSQHTIQIAPTRLGAIVKVVRPDSTEKEIQQIFIQLFDNRRMRANLFQIVTYQELFRRLAKRTRK